MADISERYRRLNILNMIVRILGRSDTPAYQSAKNVVEKSGHVVFDNSIYYIEQDCYIDVAIAPLLTQKVPLSELFGPKWGTLIFHPSPLPYGRGGASIAWAYKRQEPVTAATWFWANEKIDAGMICQQEIVKIDYSLSPRQLYERHIIPAMCRTLNRCLNELSIGLKREIKQVEQYATFDYILQKK